MPKIYEIMYMYAWRVKHLHLPWNNLRKHTMPFLLVALTEAPKLMSSLMTMSCPLRHAMWRGVLPFKFWPSTCTEIIIIINTIIIPAAIIFLKFKSSKNRGCVHRNDLQINKQVYKKQTKMIDQEKKIESYILQNPRKAGYLYVHVNHYYGMCMNFTHRHLLD